MIKKNNSTPVTTASGPAHSTGTSGRWRQAATTSDVEGVSPSQPKAGRRSNKAQSKRPGAGTSEQGTPPVVPSLDGTTLQDAGDRTRLCLSQLANERVGFMRPTISHLGGKDHQASPAESSRELWVRQLFSLAGLLESGTILLCTTTAWVTVGLDWRNQSGVHSQLGTTEEGQTICNDLQTAAGIVAGDGKVEVTEEHTLVETRAPASRQTRAAAFSNENPRLPSTQDRGHAARWWPKKSRRRPHRQVREDRGNGSHKRRRSSTRKS